MGVNAQKAENIYHLTTSFMRRSGGKFKKMTIFAPDSYGFVLFLTLQIRSEKQ